MIVVRVELWSAITGVRTELARMHICNIGGSLKRGDYSGETFKGRNSAALDLGQVVRRGRVENHPRLALHVWHLVGRMLANLGYGEGGGPTPRGGPLPSDDDPSGDTWSGDDP